MDYSEEIIILIKKVKDKKFLRYIYLLIKVFLEDESR